MVSSVRLGASPVLAASLLITCGGGSWGDGPSTPMACDCNESSCDSTIPPHSLALQRAAQARFPQRRVPPMAVL